ncbi:hypothetical protein K402DRAFT_388330 [Aulographum hederae CBS 113979]|uniref:DUF8021 domain-containing protein n=1 Tax=Aulographum hederae CBS 113979 TaxID=1176131 RepID=A0A6G1HF28_9PEZI|nr:hypothetical protein K402DRAFT_388330 [Aulographum hederae CBS 113979]
MFDWAVINRRWVADTQTGVVLGMFNFDYANKFKVGEVAVPFTLWLHEYFKVEAGKLSFIYAPMKNLIVPGGVFDDVWKSG